MVLSSLCDEPWPGARDFRRTLSDAGERAGAAKDAENTKRSSHRAFVIFVLSVTARTHAPIHLTETPAPITMSVVRGLPGNPKTGMPGLIA